MSKPVPDNRSLFDRLGGLPAITAVVDGFVARTGSDDRITSLFMNTDIPRIKKMMVERICERAGGPCKYSGKSMTDSHRDTKLEPEDFEAFMHDLEATLDQFEVPAREKVEVLDDSRSRQAEVINASQLKYDVRIPDTRRQSPTGSNDRSVC